MAKAREAQGGRNRASQNDYPRRLKLADGRQVALRLMQPDDGPKVLSFARFLPHDDLLFLRTDITEPAVVDEWISKVESGATVTVLAEIGDDLAGYASLHTEQARWTRRVGEIRAQVGPAYRGVGLGRRLAAEIFQLGQLRGIKKMAAMIRPAPARRLKGSAFRLRRCYRIGSSIVKAVRAIC
jgi:L-amino acid N-acyltransferase YncA